MGCLGVVGNDDTLDCVGDWKLAAEPILGVFKPLLGADSKPFPVNSGLGGMNGVETAEEGVEPNWWWKALAGFFFRLPANDMVSMSLEMLLRASPLPLAPA